MASAGAAGLPRGAVAVPMEEAAAAAAGAPAAPAPAAGAAAAAVGARPPAQVARVVVAWAGKPGAGAVRRVAWAAALFVLGCAAAGLALFAMTLPAADSDLDELGGLACRPTPADAVALRTASQILLLAAAAQMLTAALAVLAPARLIAGFAYIVGWFTVDPATHLLWLLVACHDSAAHEELGDSFRFVRILMYVILAVGTVVSFW